MLQARLQPYPHQELPDVQAGFRKGRAARDQIANIRWIMEKAREFQKNIYFCFIDYVDHSQLWKILKEMGIADHLTCLLRNLYAGRKQQLELVMEQIGSNPRREYVKTVYCLPANWTSMQSKSWETLNWMKHSWNQGCQEKYQ